MPARAVAPPSRSLRARRAFEAALEPSGAPAGGGAAAFSFGTTHDRTADVPAEAGTPSGDVGLFFVPVEPDLPCVVTAQVELRPHQLPFDHSLTNTTGSVYGDQVGANAEWLSEQASADGGWPDPEVVTLSLLVPSGGSYAIDADVPGAAGARRVIQSVIERPLSGPLADMMKLATAEAAGGGGTFTVSVPVQIAAPPLLEMVAPPDPTKAAFISVQLHADIGEGQTAAASLWVGPPDSDGLFQVPVVNWQEFRVPDGLGGVWPVTQTFTLLVPPGSLWGVFPNSGVPTDADVTIALVAVQTIGS